MPAKPVFMHSHIAPPMARWCSGLVLLLGIVLQACQTPNILSGANLEYQYDPGISVQMSSRVWLKEGETFVVARLQSKKLGPAPDPAELLRRYALNYQVYADYTNPRILQQDSIKPSHLHRYANGDVGILVKIDLPTLQPSAVWVLKLQDRASKLYVVHDRLIDYKLADAGLEYALVRKGDDLPLTRNTIWNADDTVSVVGPSGYKSLNFRYMAAPMPPALPAMALGNTPKGPGFTAIVQHPPSLPHVFQDPGLYHLLLDSNQRRPTFTVMALPNRFPRVVTDTELINPLIYLTTRDERKKLQESTTPKLTLDQFWSQIGLNRDNARRILRAYYTNVELANQYFTTYKEGWRTDMGMVYIIFGKPEKVTRTADKETWTYTRRNTEQVYTFTFVRKPTIFTPDNFELVRFAEYADLWYSTVDEWRRGISRN